MPVSESDVSQLWNEQPASTSEADVTAIFDEEDSKFDAEIGAAMRSAADLDPDRNASIIEFSRKAQLPPSIVEANFDGLKSSFEASKFDARKWRQDNPILADIVRKNSLIGQVVVKDQELSTLSRAFNAVGKGLDYFSEAVGYKGKTEAKSSAAEFEAITGRKLANVEAGTPPTAPTAQEFFPRTKPVAVRTDIKAPEGTAAQMADAYQRGRTQVELSGIGWQMMNRLRVGSSMYDLEKRALDLERASIPVETDTSALSSLVDAAEVAPSVVQTLKTGGVAGGLAAAGGAGIAVATGQPELVPTLAGWGLAIGSRGGSAFDSFTRESGGAFLEIRKQTTSTGKPIGDELAAGASVIYGLAAASIELVTFGEEARALGPLGDVLKTGSIKAFTQALLKDRTLLTLTKDIGRRWLSGAVGEATEEGLQQFAQELSSYAARSQQAGQLEPMKPSELVVPTLEAAAKGGSAALGLAPAMVGVNLAQHAAMRGAQKATAIVQSIPKSITAKASPDAMAEFIAKKTAEDGEPVTSIYVEPAVVARFFQENQADPEEVLGPGGAEKLKEAVATGQKLEVPMTEYIERWSKHPVNEVLPGNVAVRPGHETENQLAASSKEIEAQAKALQEQYEKEDVPAEGPNEQRFLDELERGLKASDTYTQAQVRSGVAIWRAQLRTMATRLGERAEDVFAANIVKVRNELQPEPKTQQAEAVPVPAVGLEPGTVTPVTPSRDFPGASVALAQRLEGVQPSGRAQEFYLDPVSGLRNRRAWDATERQPRKMIAVLTSPDIKGVNDDPVAGGHDKANEFLRAVGRVLFEVDQEAARSGTNFLFQVTDQAEVDAAVAKIKAALPDARLSIEAAISGDQNEAFKLLDQQVEGKRTKGELPARGKLAGGLDVGALKFGEEAAPGAVPDWLTEEIGGLEPQSFFEQTYLDHPAATEADPDPEPTGLLSREGWDALPRKKHVLSLDLRGLRAVNEKYGKGAGNALLQEFSRFAVELGGSEVNAAHLSGDEFGADHDDQLTLVAYAEHLKEKLGEHQLEVEDPATGKWEQVSVQFRYGVAEGSYGAADLALNQAKAKGEDRGGVEVSLLLQGGADLRGRAEALQRAARPQAFPRRQSQGGEPQSGGNSDGSGGTPGARGQGELPEGSGQGSEANAPGVRPERAVEPLSPESLAEVQTKISKMTKPENRAMGEAWLAYTQAPDWQERERPKISPDMEKLLARFGVVDPAGYPYGDDGRSLERPIAGPKFFGEEPAELRRQRLERGMSAEEWQEAGYKTFYQGPRGLTNFLEDGSRRLYDLVLSKNADFSTFLHESAHIWLDTLEQISTLSDVPTRLRDDWQLIRKELGAEEGKGLTREMHEKWAKSLELYFYEGKAPSSSLARAFARFSVWMKQVYRHAQAALGVELNEDLRGVFDRMFAVDAEIERQKKAAGIRPLWRSPEEAGMSPEEWQAYLDDQEKATSATTLRTAHLAIKDKLRETEKWWKDAQKEAKGEAADEYDNLPASKAWRYVKKGELTTEDGRTVSEPQMGRLDRKTVERMIGKERAKAFGNRLIKEGGEHPDGLAELFGYPTGKDALEALLSAPKQEDWVGARTNEMMSERHPGLLDDLAKLREEVGKGLHGEHNADWLLREWKALRKKVGTGPAPVEAVKRAAKAIVEKRKLTQLDAGRAMQAERMAAERKARAAAKDNYEQATVYAQQQLLNHYIAKELVEAREAKERFEDLLDNLSNDKRRSKLGLAGKEYLDNVDAILEALGAKEPEVSREIVDDRASLEKLLSRFEADMLAPGFDTTQVKQLLVDPKSWKNLSVAEMRNLDNALRQIKKAAYDASNVLLDGKRVDIKTLVNDIAGEAEHLPSMEAPPRSETLKSGAYRWRMWAHGFNAGLRDPAALLRRLGPKAVEFFWKGYIEARNTELELASKALHAFNEMWDALPTRLQENRYELVDASALPLPRDVLQGSQADRQWMWMVALNMGNDSNKHRLLGGYQWTEPQVLDFLNKNMTKEEWGFVQGVWNLLDKDLYPHVEAAYEKVNGIKPKKIQPTAIETPNGKMRGGYFPARYSPVDSRVGLRQAESAMQKLHGGPSAAASVAKSFTNERVKEFKDIILLDWGVMPGHVLEVIHYVAFDSFVRDAAKVAYNSGLNAVLERKLGAPYKEALFGTDASWLKAVASAAGDSIPKQLGAHYKLLDWGRGVTVTRAMAWNAANALGDFSNPMFAVAKGNVSAKSMAAAYVAGRGGLMPSMRQDALKKSPEMRLRADSAKDRLRRQLREVGAAGKKTRAGKVLEEVRESAFFFQETVGKLTEPLIWHAAYNDALQQQKGEAEAVAHADEMLRQSTPSKEPGEKPALLRDQRGLGLFVTFYGFFSRVYNARADIISSFADSWSEADGVGEKGAAVAALGGRWLAVSFVVSVLGELFALKFKGDRDEDDFAQWAMMRAISGEWATIPVFGQLGDAATQAVIRHVQGKPKKIEFSSRLAPGASGLKTIVDAAAKLLGKDGDGADKALDFVEAAAAVARLPSGPPIRALRYGKAVAVGDQEVQDPYELIRGITGGEKGERGE